MGRRLCVLIFAMFFLDYLSKYPFQLNMQQQIFKTNIVKFLDMY